MLDVPDDMAKHDYGGSVSVVMIYWNVCHRENWTMLSPNNETKHVAYNNKVSSFLILLIKDYLLNTYLLM